MISNILDLLPLADATLLTSLKERIRILKTVQFLCKSARTAINKFLSREYSHFDAQVSENLCQIRAYYLAQLIANKDYSETGLNEFIKKISELEARTSVVLNEHQSYQHSRPSSYVKLLDRAISLKEFLDYYRISVELDRVEYFLIQAYILSRYKLIGEYEISYGINYNPLCDDLGENSKTYAKKLVHRFQRNLSNLSCQFIFRLLFDSELEQPQRHLLKSLYFTDEVGRHVIGCYEVTRLILHHALHTNTRIKVQVNQVSNLQKKQITFFLKASPCRSKYIYLDAHEESSGNAQMFFMGIVRYDQDHLESASDYISRFMEIGFENIILSNMAQHPQYAGLHLDAKKYNPYQSIDKTDLPKPYSEYFSTAEKNFLWHKNFSREAGCVPDNSRLFLLTHVRCNQASFKNTETSKSFKLEPAMHEYLTA